MDEENFFWSEPLNVDAIVANDGDEYLANADADAQGDENFYGQNQSLAGDSGWWDDNYPGQTVQNPNTVSDTGISVVLPGGSLQFENSAQYEAWSTNPQEFAVSNIGGVNTVVPYPQVATSISPTQVLDPYSGPTTQKSLSALTARAANPTQDAYGLTILDAAQTQQLTRNINPAFINSLTDPNAGTNGVSVDYQQTVAAAARLNRASEIPDPFLTEIDKSGIVIEQDRATIATARNQIDEADQRRALSLIHI